MAAPVVTPKSYACDGGVGNGKERVIFSGLSTIWRNPSSAQEHGHE